MIAGEGRHVSHVLARLAGHGVTLVPWWPYGFERSPGTPGVVTVIHGAGEATRTAAVDVTDARTVEHVVEVLPGPGEKVWRIETSQYSVIWPDAFVIESPPTGDSTPFYLWGPDESLIYPQGPLARDRIPPLVELAGPGQTMVSQQRDPGLESVHLAYRHEGESWRQSHHLVPFGGGRALVITALAAHADLTWQAAQAVARSVTARPPGASATAGPPRL
jgi:hypothetical protein